jgi:hypothetical protein
MKDSFLFVYRRNCGVLSYALRLPLFFIYRDKYLTKSQELE